jgi:hypothetical protein
VAMTLREVCGLRPRRSRAHFSPLRLRWPSASSAPKRRSVTRAFLIRCHRRPICRTAWTACSR